MSDLDVAKYARAALTGVSSSVGALMECSLLEDVFKACKGTTIGFVRSFDFAPYDFVLVDLDQKGISPEDPFPHQAHFRSAEHLAWAYRNRDTVRAAMLDAKSVGPQDHWAWTLNLLREGMPDHFFVRLPALPDRIFVVPEAKARSLAAARQSRAKTDVRSPAGTHNWQSLAPYTVYRVDYSHLVARLTTGSTSGPDYLGLWDAASPLPLKAAFKFKERWQALSCETFMRLHELIRSCGYRRPVEMFQVATQPLAGDFSIAIAETEYTVQHKRGSHFQPDDHTFGPGSFWDFLLHHDDDSSGETIKVYLRDRTCCGEFPFTRGGMREMLGCMDGNGDEAQFQSVMESTRLLMEEGLPPLPTDQTEDPEGDDETGDKFRARSHRLAMLFHEYINGDPDKLDIPIASISINEDQNHTFGDIVVLLHRWTVEERHAYVAKRIPPVTLHSFDVHRGLDLCTALRFCHRCFVSRRLSGLSFPLRQKYAEMPMTEDPFFLICAPDTALLDRLPPSVMFMPSTFIRFPQKLRDVWGKREYAPIAYLWYHFRFAESPYDPKDLFEEGVYQGNFWITPADVVRHLREVLEAKGEMSVKRHDVGDTSSLKKFQKADLLTDIQTVVRVSREMGSVRARSNTDFIGR